MVICTLCNDLVKRDEDDAKLVFEFTPLELLHSTSDNECPSCIIMLTGFRQAEGQYLTNFEERVRKIVARCLDRRGDHCESLQLEAYFVDERTKLQLEFYVIGSTGECAQHNHFITAPGDTDGFLAWRAILPRTSISGHPSSRTALAWTRTNLERCRLEHDPCRSAGDHYLPKCVLFLDAGADNAITISLVEPADMTPGSYATLSHCWGTVRSCVTTQDTLEERRKGIHWEEIPETFQGAVKLAFKLGFKYLWIDSLCIIQDDADDWDIESAKMADIYEFSDLTIAATASAGDAHGWHTVPSNATQGILLDLPDSLKAPRIGVRKLISHWDDIESRSLRNRFPLLSRGWAFQERLLSRRILHFCGTELAYECRELSVCECGGLAMRRSPGGVYTAAVQANERILAFQNERSRNSDEDLGSESIAGKSHRKTLEGAAVSTRKSSGNVTDKHPIPTDGLKTRLLGMKSKMSLKSRSSDGTKGANSENSSIVGTTAIAVNEAIVLGTLDTPKTYIFEFHRIVEQYSALDLTRRTDCLPAFSGLCKRISHIRGDYAAGLWRESICYDLMWRVETLDLGQDNLPHHQRYCGPTWSWVSVKEPVRYWDDLRDFSPPVRRRGPLQSETTNSATCLGCTPTENIEVIIKTAGRNPFGRVHDAVLLARASVAKARLIYTYTSILGVPDSRKKKIFPSTDFSSIQPALRSCSMRTIHWDWMDPLRFSIPNKWSCFLYTLAFLLYFGVYAVRFIKRRKSTKGLESRG